MCCLLPPISFFQVRPLNQKTQTESKNCSIHNSSFELLLRSCQRIYFFLCLLIAIPITIVSFTADLCFELEMMHCVLVLLFLLITLRSISVAPCCSY